MNIPTRVTRRRGCGFCSPGGLYLVSDAPVEFCPLLPAALSVCPACGAGVHPTRGWTWVETDKLLEAQRGASGEPLLEPHGTIVHWDRCPLAYPGRFGKRCGLFWIGEQFYPTYPTLAVECVTRGDETDRELEGLVARGITPVRDLVELEQIEIGALDA